MRARNEHDSLISTKLPGSDIVCPQVGDLEIYMESQSGRPARTAIAHMFVMPAATDVRLRTAPAVRRKAATTVGTQGREALSPWRSAQTVKPLMFLRLQAPTDHQPDGGGRTIDAARQLLYPRSPHHLGDRMFRIKFKKGRGIPGIRRGRHRWFVVNEARTSLSIAAMPRSFPETEQQAWEHAEWACGAIRHNAL